jgi:hypothetical protein
LRWIALDRSYFPPVSPSFADLQVLPVEVSQELQNEEESSEGEVDEGLSQASWEGAHSGACFQNLFELSLHLL